jgi:bacterioferritin-associated ferredoxin
MQIIMQPLRRQNRTFAMIVCLCHRVSDRDIHRVVGEGVANFEHLQDLTRVASNCGCCLDSAQMIFEEACASRPAGCGNCHGACTHTRAAA